MKTKQKWKRSQKKQNLSGYEEPVWDFWGMTKFYLENQFRGNVWISSTNFSEINSGKGSTHSMVFSALKRMPGCRFPDSSQQFNFTEPRTVQIASPDRTDQELTSHPEHQRSRCLTVRSAWMQATIIAREGKWAAKTSASGQFMALAKANRGAKAPGICHWIHNCY